MGIDLKTCQLLKTETKVVTVDLPPGSRPGFKVLLEGQGHEVVEDLQKQVGDLEVFVATVDSGNFRLLGDRMELTIVMSVTDALQVGSCCLTTTMFS
jgi:DnaJ-class molecular chaperone